MEKYESIERKIMKPIMRFVYGFVPMTYGTIVTPFRMSTFSRKVNNKQTVANRMTDNSTYYLGLVAGLSSLMAAASYIVTESNNGNNTPIIATGIALALTNTLSGVFELGISAGRYENKLEKKLA